MAYIEVQMAVPVFLAAQRNALRNLGLCPPILPAMSGVQFVVDRIEIGATNALRHHEETEFPVFYEDQGQTLGTPNRCMGYQTQLAQEVTVHLTTLGEILAQPNGAPSVVVPIAATLVFDLDFYCLEHDCYLRVSLSRVEPGPLPALPPPFAPLTTLPQALQDLISEHLTAHLRPFAPTTSVPAGLGGFRKGTKFLNAGISVDTQMGRIALRAQIGGSHSNLDVPWSNFFKGHFPDHLQGRDWGFFVEAGLLTETLKALVWQAIPPDDNLQAFPGCTYSNANGRAVLGVDVLLIYHLYRNRDIDIDINVQAQPRVDIQLSVDTPNWLKVDFDFSHLLDSDDPLVNLARSFLEVVGVPIESILLRLAGSAAMTALAGSPLQICKQVSPTHIQCEMPVRVPHVPGSLQTALTSVLALGDGIALAGTMTVRELTAARLDVSVREFQVHAPSITCGPASMALVAAFRQDPSRFAVLHAQAFLTNLGTAPLNLCGAPDVLKGAEGPFPPSGVRPDSPHAPIDLRVDIAAPPQSYYASPYPLDLLVRTSGGARLLRFNPPPVTDADHERMAAELLVKIGDCQMLIDPFFGGGGRYNPRWSPRPPDDFAVEHMWEVVISGLPGGEAVALVDGEERELVMAVGGARPVRVSVVVPSGGERELSILRLSAPRMHRGRTVEDMPGERGLEVRQTLLLNAGSLPLAGRLRSLRISNAFGTPCIIAALDGGITAIDVSNPRVPMVLRSWEVEGARGAIDWQRSLLVFGDEGVELIDRAGERRTAAGECALGAVRDAAGDGRALCALTGEGVEFYSARLCRTGLAPVDGGRSLARVAGRLVVGGARGLTLLEPRNPERGLREGLPLLEDVCVAVVRPTPPGEAGSFVATFDDGTSGLFRLSGEDAEQIARFPGTPWYAEAVRLGALLARPGVDRRSVDFYRFGESSSS